MSITQTNTFQVKLLYGDYDTRNYKIPIHGEMSQEIYTNAKQRIAAFNEAAADSSSSVSQTFVSDGGAKVARITESTLIQKVEEVIYNG